MPRLSSFCVTARKRKVIQELEAAQILPSKLSAKLERERDHKVQRVQGEAKLLLRNKFEKVSRENNNKKKKKKLSEHKSVRNNFKTCIYLLFADVATVPLG